MPIIDSDGEKGNGGIGIDEDPEAPRGGMVELELSRRGGDGKRRSLRRSGGHGATVAKAWMLAEVLSLGLGST